MPTPDGCCKEQTGKEKEDAWHAAPTRAFPSSLTHSHRLSPSGALDHTPEAVYPHGPGPGEEQVSREWIHPSLGHGYGMEPPPWPPPRPRRGPCPRFPSVKFPHHPISQKEEMKHDYMYSPKGCVQRNVYGNDKSCLQREGAPTYAAPKDNAGPRLGLWTCEAQV